MAVFAISDLHLPGSNVKPMDVFGEHWENHFERIREDWMTKVGGDDVVLLPGDFSWAMTLSDALPDLDALAKLPGRKLIVRGNHDFWWSSVTQVRAALDKNTFALQNDCVALGGIVFCGTRGWTVTDQTQACDEKRRQDVKIYRREVIRLELALKSAQRIADGAPIIALMHYPPFDEKQQPSGFTDLMESYGVKDVVYGHLHGQSLKYAFSGQLRGVNYHQVSCDGLDFKLLRLSDYD